MKTNSFLSFRPTRVAVIGDSITGSSTPFANNRILAGGDSPIEHAYAASTKGWELVINAGIGGETSDQIAARIQTDIIPANVDICIIGSCYWNEPTHGHTPEYTQSHIISMVNQLRAAGIQPVICTPTPDTNDGSSTAARILYMTKMINWVRQFCIANKIPCIDIFSQLVNTTNGCILSSLSTTGVHLPGEGYKIIGETINLYLDSVCSQSPYPFIKYQNDTTDLLSGHGLFLSDTGGVGTGFSFTSTTGATASIVTDTNILGRMQRIEAIGTSGNAYIDSSVISTGWSVGDIIELSGIVTCTPGGTVPKVRLVITGSPSPSDYIYYQPQFTPQTRGKFRYSQKIATGTTGILVRMQVGPGTGVLDVGQLTLRNLTTIGVPMAGE